MAIIRAFKGFRPKKEWASRIASPPYDVLNSDEARKEVIENPYSMLYVTKPEVDLPAGTDLYSEEVYLKGASNLGKMISEGYFFRDEQACLYIYAQTMNAKTQYGIVACANVLDYLNNAIRRHELTRTEKEEDRKRHIQASGFHAEPVFFTHPPHKELDDIVSRNTTVEPEYDFIASDGVRHRFWIISDVSVISRIETIFATDIPFTYVADGHHRTAAAASVASEKRHSNPDHTGREEYNYFLAVLFPSNQLTILDYNRVVKDLNGMSNEDFLNKLENAFTVSARGTEEYKPTKHHNFGLYLDGQWYSLTSRKDTYDDHNPIGRLDVTILSRHVLSPLLNITNLRKSKRIDFVGGIRGTAELTGRVDSGEMKAAFTLYPVSMEELMEIADTDKVMPPKTTWFEPKLRSGLILHKLDE